MFELRKEGHTLREIGEKFGLTYEQVHDFFKRHNRNQRKLAARIEIKPKDRPRKDGTELPPSIQQLSKATQLQYELAQYLYICINWSGKAKQLFFCRQIHAFSVSFRNAFEQDLPPASSLYFRQTK